MDKIRVVADANVLISGLLWTGASHRIVRASENRQLALVATPAMLEEVQEALGRPKFARRLTSQGTSVTELMEVLLAAIEVIPTPPAPRVVKADPDDDKVVACAVAGGAAYIVSGDDHLLALRTHAGIRIVAPSVFWAAWMGGRP